MKEAHKHAASTGGESRKRTILIVVAAILAVLVLIGVCVYIYLDNLVTEGDAGQLTDDIVSTAPENSKKTANILIAGIDYDKDDEGRDYSNGLGMTDVVLLACCDFENNTLNLLQIPRDSYVGEEVPTGGTGKINAVFSHGKDTTNRISNLAAVINDQFKLPVDYYITLDMNAFTDLINILGGIEMYVPWEVDNYDENGNVISTVPAGTHVIDGSTAELIVRSRHSYAQGDIKRLEMQQYFYAAVFKTFLSFPMSDLIKVAPGLAHYVNTEMSVSDMVWMFGWLQKVDKSNIGIARCPGGGLNETNGHTGMYGINVETLAPLLNDYFRPYADPVSASDLGLPTGLIYPSGEIAATMTYMGDLSAQAESAG